MQLWRVCIEMESAWVAESTTEIDVRMQPVQDRLHPKIGSDHTWLKKRNSYLQGSFFVG